MTVSGDELKRLAMGDEKAQRRFAPLLTSEVGKRALGVLRQANAEVWGSEALDAKTHCLVNLAILASINKPDEVRVRVRGLLRGGVSAEEIAAVFLHVLAYVGFPTGVEATLTLAEVLHELAEEGLLPAVADPV
jgi:4-carboxymuconolactone decarboxylase